MTDFLLEYGYLGLFIGAFLAATIIPLSSDVMFIGVLAAGCAPIPSLVAATLGNWLGGLTSYWLGRLGKWEWLEKYFKVKRRTIEKQHAKIKKYGSWLALFTWFPFIGDLMAIGLGFYRLDFRKVAVFMFIGKCIRYTVWLAVFYWVRPLFT